jgi:hypothetical protein
MDFKSVIETYQAMQARAEQLIDTNDPSITWEDGSWGYRQIQDNDIRLDMDSGDDVIRCTGTFWTMTTGGSYEFFDCTIPVEQFANVAESCGPLFVAVG